jgi:geranylgeranyl pyrophosphate synthase
MTLPILRALQIGTSSDRQKTRDLLFSGAPDDRIKLRQSANLQMGVESAQATAERFASRAIRCLQSFPLCAERRVLEDIARFSVFRSH